LIFFGLEVVRGNIETGSTFKGFTLCVSLNWVRFLYNGGSWSSFWE
jgi:hypothetical protein